ncbi:MAG TPA: hypothetical protein PKD19_00355 [Candidatus Saccharibacteria bacterium]|nr:hypothetical protein [Candidatus Saccharibacteria bacterium]HMR38136.1 hypothetical protein [Candidatus Saccharibacteria bacterium]
MKPNRLIETIFALLATVFLGVVLHAPYTVFIGSAFPEIAVPIKAWKEALMLVAGVLLLVEIIRKKQWRIVWDSWLMRLMIAFVGLHLLMLPVFWQGSVAAVAGLMIDLRFIAFFMLVYVFLRLAPGYKELFWRIGAIGAIIVIGFGFLQLFLPHDILRHIGYSNETIRPYTTVDRNYDYIRINSTLRGPNPLGAYAGMVVLFLAAFVTTKQFRRLSQYWKIGLILAGSMTLVVLFISHGRAAWLGTVVGLMVMLAIRYWKYINRMVVSIGVVGVLLTGGVLYMMKDNPAVSTVLWHEDPYEGGEVNSNDGHWHSLVDGTERMLRQPFGAGVGSTGSASLMNDNQSLIIENQYLFIAHEVGWLGLGLFGAIFVMTMRQLWFGRGDWRVLAVFASGICLAVIGLLLPVWVDDTVSIVWWGLAAIGIATMNKRKMKTI